MKNKTLPPTKPNKQPKHTLSVDAPARAARGFKKGQSGNPSGRPKGALGLLTDLKPHIRERGQEILDALFAALQKPGERVSAATALMDRGYGRPVHVVHHRIIKSIRDLNDDELKALCDEAPPVIDGQALEADQDAKE